MREGKGKGVDGRHQSWSAGWLSFLERVVFSIVAFDKDNEDRQEKRELILDHGKDLYLKEGKTLKAHEV